MFVHKAPNGRERSTRKSIPLTRGVMALGLTIGSLMLPGAGTETVPEGGKP